MRMAHNGLAHRRLSLAHHKNATPGSAVLLSGLLTVLPACALAARGISGIDIYGWMGSLSVYGFMTTYGLAAIGLPLYLKRNRRLTAGTIALSIAATVATLLALAGTLYPVPAAPLNWLPYFYLAYILCGVAWFYASRLNPTAAHLVLTNILIPDLRMLADKSRQQIRALLRIQINHLHPKLFQPLHATRKVPALPNYQRLNPKLPDQPAAVPARSQRRHHNLVAISPLPPRSPKRIRLAMHRRIAVLHSAISP